MDVELRSFSGVNGNALRRIPFLDLSWADSLNEIGDMQVTISASEDVENLCTPWKTILAAVYDDRILHAGYVTHLRRTDSEGIWTVDVGGPMSVLEKRLVINPDLTTHWKEGRVEVDEENPSGYWQYSLKGSYADIIGKLVSDTMNTFGELPFAVMPTEGGSHERNYNSFDYATIYDRIQDITQLEDGVEVRFDPYIRNGRLLFMQRTAEEIVDKEWKWNVTIPSAYVALLDTDIEGNDLCTQSYGSGGKEEDMLLVSRATSSLLTNKGYPVLQTANKEHSQVSEYATLKSYVNADVAAGRRYGITRSLRADITLDIKPGDWADVRTQDGVYSLKVTDVSGSLSDGYLTVQVTERY